MVFHVILVILVIIITPFALLISLDLMDEAEREKKAPRYVLAAFALIILTLMFAFFGRIGDVTGVM